MWVILYKPGLASLIDTHARTASALHHTRTHSILTTWRRCGACGNDRNRLYCRWQSCGGVCVVLIAMTAIIVVVGTTAGPGYISHWFTVNPTSSSLLHRFIARCFTDCSLVAVAHRDIIRTTVSCSPSSLIPSSSLCSCLLAWSSSLPSLFSLPLFLDSLVASCACLSAVIIRNTSLSSKKVTAASATFLKL